jgi:2'-5' RNA ligase
MDIRCFLAFELPPGIQTIVAGVLEQARKALPDLRWVRLQNMHLTVVFLGNIQEEDLEPLGQLVEGVCQGYGPFDVCLSGMGVFPNQRNPRVFWLGLEGDIERMALFRNALQKTVKAFGVKQEKRPYKPHLTLARFGKVGKGNSRVAECISKYRDLGSPTYPLGELILFRSELKPTGAVYTALKSWPLRTGQSGGRE